LEITTQAANPITVQSHLLPVYPLAGSRLYKYLWETFNVIQDRISFKKTRIIGMGSKEFFNLSITFSGHGVLERHGMVRMGCSCWKFLRQNYGKDRSTCT